MHVPFRPSLPPRLMQNGYGQGVSALSVFPPYPTDVDWCPPSESVLYHPPARPGPRGPAGVPGGGVPVPHPWRGEQCFGGVRAQGKACSTGLVPQASWHNSAPYPSWSKGCTSRPALSTCAAWIASPSSKEPSQPQCNTGPQLPRSWACPSHTQSPTRWACSSHSSQAR